MCIHIDVIENFFQGFLDDNRQDAAIFSIVHPSPALANTCMAVLFAEIAHQVQQLFKITSLGLGQPFSSASHRFADIFMDSADGTFDLLLYSPSVNI